jgi:hypothetical protein
VFVRLVRAALRKLVDGLKTGITNLYGWAQLVGNSFVPTMDSLATSFLYLKNSVGAAVSPLLDAFAPAIEFVINRIVECINALNQLFAALTGATTWRKAVRKQASFGDAIDNTGGSAGKAADEIERMLLGIDELNKLPDPNDKSGGGGGGASGTDYSGMFTVEPVANPFLEWANTDDWTDLGAAISDYLADGLEKANAWMETNGLAMARSWGARLSTMLSGVFTNERFSTELGEAIGNGINLATTFVTTFADASQWDVDLGGFLASALRSSVSTINWTDLGRTMTAEYKILSGILHGFVENWSSEDAVSLGTNIATLINAAWNNVPWQTAIPDAVTLGTRILETLNASLSNISLSDMVSSLCEGVRNADWQSFWNQIADSISALANQNWSQIGADIGSALQTMLTTMPWDRWIPNLVGLATGVLTAINNAISQIKWGPYNKEGTVLNKIWTGIQNADWAALWAQTKEFIKNTWPVWTFALAINFLASLGKVAHTITQAAILSAAFGNGAAGAAGAVGGTSALTFAGGVLATVATLAVGFALTFDGIKKFTTAVSENDTWGKIKAFIETHLGTTLARYGLELIFPGSDTLTHGLAIALKIGMLLNWNGVEGGTTVDDNGHSGLSGSFGDESVSVPFTARITSIQDKIPKKSKVIEKMKSIFSSSDVSSGYSREVEGMTSVFSDKKLAPRYSKKVDGMQSEFSTKGFAGTYDKTVHDMHSELTDRTFAKSFSKTVPGMTGDLVHASDNVPASEKNLASIASFFKSGFAPTWSTPTADVKGLVYNGSLNKDGSTLSGLWSYVKASWTNYTTKDSLFSSLWAYVKSSWTNYTTKDSMFSNLWSYVKGAFWYSAASSDGSLFSGLWSWVKAKWWNYDSSTSLFSNLWAWVKAKWTKDGGLYRNGSWAKIQGYASGGLPTDGQMFVAREAGPELVGTLGGHTAVMNNDQIVASVSAGVARAISNIKFQMKGAAGGINTSQIRTVAETLYSAKVASYSSSNNTPEYDSFWMDNMASKIASQITASNNAYGNDRDIVVMLDGDVLFRSTVKENRKNTIRTGVNAMMGG